LLILLCPVIAGAGHFLYPKNRKTITMKTAVNHRIVCSLAAICALPLQTFAAGFVEDASATLNLRNFYINRNFTNPAYPQSKAEEWTQNFILDFRSGFTQGPVAARAPVALSCCRSMATGVPPMISVAWRWPGK
jgi:hypothetical protein